MKEFVLKNLLLSAAVVISLSACSSDSEPAVPNTNETPAVPNDQMNDQPDQTPIGNPDNTTNDPDTENPEIELPAENPDQNPDDILNPDVDPAPAPDPTGSDDPVILIPNVTQGSDLDRLIGGISNQASRTILDLAQRLSEGTDLTEQQNDCLGTYDPAMGEVLLSVSCKPALPTGDVALYVGEAAFYDTESCNASIFEGNTSDCQLQRASITIRTDFMPPVPPQRRPQLLFAGMEIYYAIDNTTLRLENTADMLTGAFRCDIELNNGQTSSAATNQSCDDIIKRAADRIETLLANQ